MAGICNVWDTARETGRGVIACGPRIRFHKSVYVPGGGVVDDGAKVGAYPESYPQ